MRRRPLTRHQDSVRMWVGITSGAGALVVLGFVVAYGYSAGVFS